MAGCDLSYSNRVLLLLLGVADVEGDAIAVLYGVCRLVAGRRVNRFETASVSDSLTASRVTLLLAEEIAEVGNGVLCVADQLALGLSTVELLSFYV